MTFLIEIKLITLTIALATTFVDYVVPYLPKFANRKPVNCSFCLCFWLSVFFSCLTMEWFLLTAPLFLRIIERRLL